MKVACITPTRGDRPEFLRHCRWLMREQSMEHGHIVVSGDPGPGKFDLGDKLRMGLTSARDCGFDLALVIEDDDWYGPRYVEESAAHWEQAGRPALIGITAAKTYHIGRNEYMAWGYPQMSALANMGFALDERLDSLFWADAALERGELSCKPAAWSIDAYLGLMHSVHCRLFTYHYVGIKHGMAGCMLQHRKTLKESIPDPDHKLLTALVDPVSYKFYQVMKHSGLINTEAEGVVSIWDKRGKDTWGTPEQSVVDTTLSIKPPKS